MPTEPRGRVQDPHSRRATGSGAERYARRAFFGLVAGSLAFLTDVARGWAGGARGAATTVRVQLKEFKVVPSVRSVRAGRVVFVALDVGQLPHNPRRCPSSRGRRRSRSSGESRARDTPRSRSCALRSRTRAAGSRRGRHPPTCDSPSFDWSKERLTREADGARSPSQAPSWFSSESARVSGPLGDRPPSGDLACVRASARARRHARPRDRSCRRARAGNRRRGPTRVRFPADGRPPSRAPPCPGACSESIDDVATSASPPVTLNVDLPVTRRSRAERSGRRRPRPRRSVRGRERHERGRSGSRRLAPAPPWRGRLGSRLPRRYPVVPELLDPARDQVELECGRLVLGPRPRRREVDRQA